MRFTLASLLVAAGFVAAAPLAARDTYYGQATFYYQGGNAGSCGWYKSDSDYIVAVSGDMMSSWMCGKSIWVKNTATGQTQNAMIADTCPTCVGGQSLDLSQGLFDSLASESQGVFPLAWGFN